MTSPNFSCNFIVVGLSVGINGIQVFEHAADYLPALLSYGATIASWTHVALVYSNNQVCTAAKVELVPIEVGLLVRERRPCRHRSAEHEEWILLSGHSWHRNVWSLRRRDG